MSRRNNVGTIGGTLANEICYISARALVLRDGDLTELPVVTSEQADKLEVVANSVSLNGEDAIVNEVLHTPGQLIKFRLRRLGDAEGEFGFLVSHKTPAREETTRFQVTLVPFL
jgi:hypothetical protein